VSEETLRELAEEIDAKLNFGHGFDARIRLLLEQAAAALRTSAERVEKLQSQLSEATKPVTDEEVATLINWLKAVGEKYDQGNGYLQTASMLERLAREKEEALQECVHIAKGARLTESAMEDRALAAERRCQAYEKDSKRYRWLIEQCGYVQDGSDQTVGIFQDDATRCWHVRAGSKHYGEDNRSLDSVIDAALTGKPK
jgi:hypothetical protein